MKINRIFIKNIGPFDELDLRLDEQSIALVGANASGKTFLLSSIVDFIYEHLRAIGFDDTLPSTGNGYRYFRMTSTKYVKNPAESGFIWLEGKIGGKELYYLEQYNLKNAEQVAKAVGIKVENVPWPEIGYVKKINSLNEAEKQVAKRVAWNEPIFFLPATKFENESWKTEDFFRDNQTIDNPTSSKLGHPIEIYSSIEENKTWLINEVIDSFHWHNDVQSARMGIVRFILNELIDPSKKLHLNFGLSRDDRLNVMDEDNNIMLKSLNHLSLGQMSILNLVLNIMRLGDSNVLPQEMSGLVIVDEIDTHLTGDYKTTIVPKIIEIFQNVQFVITTHDPESVAGLENNSQIKLVELPVGKEIFARNFGELKKARENLRTISDNTRRMIEEIRQATKPVLVVEDEYANIYKVGWLKSRNKSFDKQNLETIFEETAPFSIISSNGASNLQAFLDLPNMPDDIRYKKIAGLFDFDEAYVRFNGLNRNGWPKGIEGNDAEGLYKKNQDGKRVAMLLPVPENRKNIASSEFKGKSRLAIELYFDDEMLGNQHYQPDISTPGGLMKFVGDKPTFWEECIDYPEDAFREFGKLFDKVEDFLDVAHRVEQITGQINNMLQ